jgi:hypothetical protein
MPGFPGLNEIPEPAAFPERLLRSLITALRNRHVALTLEPASSVAFNPFNIDRRKHFRRFRLRPVWPAARQLRIRPFILRSPVASGPNHSRLEYTTMSNTIAAPTAAGPLLGLALEKIARTPRARLAVGYTLVPHLAPLGPDGAWADARLKARIQPGMALYLDFILAAGTTGEVLPLATLPATRGVDDLPLANQQIVARQYPATGGMVNLVA